MCPRNRKGQNIVQDPGVKLGLKEARNGKLKRLAGKERRSRRQVAVSWHFSYVVQCDPDEVEQTRITGLVVS